LIVKFIDEKKVEFGVEPIVTEVKSAGVTIARAPTTRPSPARRRNGASLMR